MSGGATMQSARVRGEPHTSGASLSHLFWVRNGPGAQGLWPHCSGPSPHRWRPAGSIRRSSSGRPPSASQVHVHCLPQSAAGDALLLSSLLMLVSMRNPHPRTHLPHPNTEAAQALACSLLPSFPGSRKPSVTPSGFWIQDSHQHHKSYTWPITLSQASSL